MKKLILSTAIALGFITLLFSCKKEVVPTQKSDMEQKLVDALQVPDNQMNGNYQNIIVNDKLYQVEFEYIGEGENLDVNYIDMPSEITSFLQTYEATLVPHMVLGSEDSYLFYYKNWDDFLAHVEFSASTESNQRSLNGAQVILWEHVSNGTTGYGRSIVSDATTPTNVLVFTGNGPISTVSGYGNSQYYVGNTMNDKTSAVQIIERTAEEPVTFVGARDAINSSQPYHYANNSAVVITKLAAYQPDGTNVANNTANLHRIKRTWATNWGDRISGFQFAQSPTRLNVGVTMR